MRLIESKTDKQEYFQIKQELTTKAERADIDMYVMAVQNQRLELEQRQKSLEKDIDDFVGNVSHEMENLKTSVLQSLNKKVDYGTLESLKDSIHKKVDHEYFQTVSNKLKTECQGMLTQFQTEHSFARKSKDDKVEERLQKAEMHSERALDEIFFVRDQFKQLQEERKQDVQETAELIKQIVNNGKVD